MRGAACQTDQLSVSSKYITAGGGAGAGSFRRPCDVLPFVGRRHQQHIPGVAVGHWAGVATHCAHQYLRYLVSGQGAQGSCLTAEAHAGAAGGSGVGRPHCRRAAAERFLIVEHVSALRCAALRIHALQSARRYDKPDLRAHMKAHAVLVIPRQHVLAGRLAVPPRWARPSRRR